MRYGSRESSLISEPTDVRGWRGFAEQQGVLVLGTLGHLPSWRPPEGVRACYRTTGWERRGDGGVDMGLNPSLSWPGKLLTLSEP